MVKYLEELAEGEKEIIRTLKTKKTRGITVDELKNKIEEDTGERFRKGEISEYLSNLIEDGYVRYRVRRDRTGEHRVFYLSKGIGAGYRAQKKLRGGFNLFYDIGKMYRRITGGALVLFGIALLMHQNSSLSGAAILNNLTTNGIGSLFSLSLVIIGALAFFKSFKK